MHIYGIDRGKRAGVLGNSLAPKLQRQRVRVCMATRDGVDATFTITLAKDGAPPQICFPLRKILFSAI